MERKMITRPLPGQADEAPGARELAHRALVRRAAAESIVLLENNGVLPLAPGTPVALYGGYARRLIKGGTGSGLVNNRSNVSIDEGLRNAGFVITNTPWLDDLDARYQREYDRWVQMLYDLSAGAEPMALYNAHASHPMPAVQGAPVTEKTAADVAFVVLGRISGEAADRKAEKGDYYISDPEKALLAQVAALYPATVLVLNVGGVMDLSFLDEIPVAAVLLLGQPGMEGGSALADVVSGRVNPCGRLTDTWAAHYEDYPSSAAFGTAGNALQAKYTEGIFVGYRYFDSFEVKPRYPFGCGLSYTDFSLTPGAVTLAPGSVTAEIAVTNTGSLPGRQVVQLYAALPRDERRREAKRLVAFGKTGLLAPGGSETVTLRFDLSLLECWHTGRSQWYLPAGDYTLLAGESSACVQPAAVLTLARRTVTQTLTPVCELVDALTELTPAPEQTAWQQAELAALLAAHPVPRLALEGSILPRPALTPPPENPLLDEARALVKGLTVQQKAALVCGQRSAGSAEFIGNAAVTLPGAAGETTGTLKELGIASTVLADGPAGIRIQQHYDLDPVSGRIYALDRRQTLENRFFGKLPPHQPGAVTRHQYASAIPVGTLLAQSFDVPLLEEVGRMMGTELEEFGVTWWLAPGLNIHRNPLCGRNFEYFSEDPVVSGSMAAAITRGVQSCPGLGTTIKHFACNNQEVDRYHGNSVVSEQALREVYLKGFEIAVRESQPMAIMTSYNRLNGVHTANSYDLCTTAARQEWGFAGVIMTDWTTTNSGNGSSAAKCIRAGNDLVMPGTPSDVKEIEDAVARAGDLALDEADLDECAARIIAAVLASNAYAGAVPYAPGRNLPRLTEQL